MSYELSDQGIYKYQFPMLPLVSAGAAEAETYLPTVTVLTALRDHCYIIFIITLFFVSFKEITEF